jgi:hypothetical protein
MSAGAQLIYDESEKQGFDPRPVLEASPFGLPVRPLGDVGGSEGPSDVANRLKAGLDILYRERKKGRATPAEVKKFQSEIHPIVYRPNNYRPGLRANGEPKDRPTVEEVGGPLDGRVVVLADKKEPEPAPEPEPEPSPKAVDGGSEGIRFVTMRAESPRSSGGPAGTAEPGPAGAQ